MRPVKRLIDFEKKMAMNGFILLAKPPGITSFHALADVKKKLATPKVGHAGTLDRFASGLLIAAAGAYTRLIRLFAAGEKEYRAVAVFGQGTDTLDPEGAPSGGGPVPGQGELEMVLPRFRGKIRQRPPAYSAVHVAGRRAYQLARSGQDVSPPEREVVVTELVLEEYRPPRAFFRVTCSAGTYIRALARDMAAALGTQAHLEALTRTRIGAFRLEDAVAPLDFDPERHLLGLEAVGDRLPGLGRATLAPGREAHLRCGKTLSPGLFDRTLQPGWNAVFSPAGGLVAVVDRTGDVISYVMVVGD